MTEPRTYKKDHLVRGIERARKELFQFIESLSEEQLTVPLDARGWSVLDHLNHLTAWERSVVYLLQGRPRHQGLGVEEDLYVNGDEDAINAAVKDNTRLSQQEAVAAFYETHSFLTGLLTPLTDTELEMPYRHYLPDEPGEGEGPPAMQVVSGNTSEHYREHLQWMRQIVAGAAS